MLDITQTIAGELSAQPSQINAAITLLDEGATVPFIARYRKEKTGGLSDTQLRQLSDRLGYLRELEDRKQTILAAIDEQKKLTPELKSLILNADTKTRLEDLYLPYKKKRVTKAQIARDAGLEPLALGLLENPSLDPDTQAGKYLNPDKEITDTGKALDGARQILMERFAEDADLLAKLRKHIEETGLIISTVVEGKEQEAQKYKDYFEFKELIRKIPSHRALALFRGRNESFLKLDISTENDDGSDPCLHILLSHTNISNNGRAADDWLCETARQAWRNKIRLKLDIDLKTELKLRSDEEAIKVFADNLNDLLMASPAGPKAIIGLDPGLRTGVKVAVIDMTGKVIATDTIYPHAPKNQWDQSIERLRKLAVKTEATLISIGNGTASRETDRLARELIKKHPELHLGSIVVSEAGASVYSASELASNELPELDVSLRGAVSIARRLQDPLAELVKIDPKSIGVGQYQHDVNQTRLGNMLEAVTEDCVNAVGVDLNTASTPLLTHVSGLNATIAQNIVEYRNENSVFKKRNDLKKVPRLGPKAFEQCAGFLRIMSGSDPLDRSSVHPEAYPVVKKILDHTKLSIDKLIGNSSILKSLDPALFVDEQFGLPTVKDILSELVKPGRDPRPEFVTAEFQEGVEEISDLKDGMKLEGVITNVTNFGAFVDIGVHQDGLVHISQLADKFVKDPREVVKTGDVVKVTVVEVDIKRKRIGLTMKTGATAPQKQPEKTATRKQPSKPDRKPKKPQQAQQPKTNQPQRNNTFNNAFANAFAKAGIKK